MGGMSQPAQQAPQTPDPTTEEFRAARRARALSLFSLGGSWQANFRTATSLGTKPGVAGETYGQPIQAMLGGGGQFGDDTGTTPAPNLTPPPKLSPWTGNPVKGG